MRNRNEAEEPLHLHIHIDAHITGGTPMDYDVEIPIPETYDAADVRALTARELEDAAFALNLREFGRAPALGALVAAAARIRAVLDALRRMPRVEAFREHRERLRSILEASNGDITDAWEERPE